MRPRVVLVVVTVLVAAAIVWFLRRPKPAPVTASAAAAVAHTAASSNSNQAKLLHELITLGVTPDRAMQYFSLAVAPLPGVAVDGLTSDPGDFDGTAAVYFLKQVWTSLTPEQQKAAHDAMLGTGGTIARRTKAMGAVMRQPRLVLARFDVPEDKPAHDYLNLAWNGSLAIAQAMGVNAVGITLVTEMNSAKEYAHTQSWPDNSDQAVR